MVRFQANWCSSTEIRIDHRARHLNEPKTGSDVTRCDPKKDRILKNAWIFSSLSVENLNVPHCVRDIPTIQHLCAFQYFVLFILHASLYAVSAAGNAGCWIRQLCVLVRLTVRFSCSFMQSNHWEPLTFQS